MILIQEHVDIGDKTTFRLPSRARYFAVLEDKTALPDIALFAHTHNTPVVVLGSGSNVLAQEEIDGFVIQNKLLGIQVLSEDVKKAVS